MPFGSEFSVLASSPAQKALWRVRGDFHIGRWLRYFHLKHMLKVRPLTVSRILDAGCGEGQYSFFLHRFFPSACIVGIDLNQLKIENCRRLATALNAGIEFECADLENYIPDRPFDLIVLNNVLCSVSDYETALRRVTHALNAGGSLIIQDMNKPFVIETYGEQMATDDSVRNGFSIDECLSVLENLHLQVLWAKPTLGPAGRWAHEVFDAVRKNRLVLNLVFPFLLLASFIDIFWQTEKGAGLFIWAVKRRAEP